MKVLFICRGNVGRSQIAEVIFNLLAEGKHVSISAGTEVKEHRGQTIGDLPSAKEVLTVLDEIGVDARSNKRTQLTKDMISSVDLVVSMAEAETLPDYLIKHEGVIYWELTDPFQQSLEFTRDTRDQIKTLIKNLLTTLN